MRLRRSFVADRSLGNFGPLFIAMIGLYAISPLIEGV